MKENNTHTHTHTLSLSLSLGNPKNERLAVNIRNLYQKNRIEQSLMGTENECKGGF
jgi:hypothetical protein